MTRHGRLRLARSRATASQIGYPREGTMTTMTETPTVTELDAMLLATASTDQPRQVPADPYARGGWSDAQQSHTAQAWTVTGDVD